jgi:hypothetical protein
VELRYENEPTVHVVAFFSGDDLEIHRAALRRLVVHPDQLEVRPSPWPLVRLEEIRADIHEMATAAEPGLFSGWSTGRGKVNVRLRADGERVATQLRERYGDAVDLTVGFLHFPDCAFADALAARMAQRLEPSPLLPGEVQIAPREALHVTSGSNLGNTIRLVNEGVHDVVVLTNGQIVAPVVDPQTNEIVGGYSGAQTLPLARFRAPAGGSIEIPLLVGTASTVPKRGYAVPPGRWAIEIAVGLEEHGSFRAPLIPLDVLP